jgi:hypothetical protein
MSCNFTADFELARNVTYGNFETLREICPTTYIRPDPGTSRHRWLLARLALTFYRWQYDALARLVTLLFKFDLLGRALQISGSLLLLFFHLPACIIRAVKWESAQYLVSDMSFLTLNHERLNHTI